MKRIVGLVLVFCLVFSMIAEAVAEPKWEITQQTKVTMKEKKGKATSVTVTVKAKGKGIKYQWVFVDPEDSRRTSTGKKVAREIKELKGLVVKGATSNKLTLTKIPDALNGWSIYCHLYSNAYKMDTDPVVITLPGMEPPAESEGEGKDSEGGEEAKSGKTEETAEKKASDEEGGEDEEDEGATEEPKEFTVSANGNILYKADSMGNPDGDAVSSLTFTGSGNVVVKSEDPFKSWTVNGVRFEPEEEISSFKMLNLSSDTSISLKVAAKTAASAKVDESNMLTVTCKGCTFTYLRGGLKKVASGKVPSGAVIYVFADSFDAAANGYVVNGGEAQSQGAASMQVTVTEDTEIVVK
ncbi:MAG: hypothetical protein IJQ88_08880 [Clostridia bacterium]|nr:hypothetical protein [Clostridia bacterium]